MKIRTVLALCVLIILAGCGQPTTQPTEPNPSATPNLPNPASVYCEQQGYRLEIRTAQDGSQSGVCIFPDGSECDEWAFYRHECTPATQDASMPNPASVFCEQQGYAVDIRTASDGSQSGVCIFPDGGECDEWAFFRGDCNAPATPAPLAIPTANFMRRPPSRHQPRLRRNNSDKRKVRGRRPVCEGFRSQPGRGPPGGPMGLPRPRGIPDSFRHLW